MKLIFAGTPDFAATVLQALMAAEHEVVLVLTRPDRPSGRGMKLTPSPVKVLAERLQLRVAQPPSLCNKTVQALLRDTKAELMVVAAYGLLLPAEILRLPIRGCLNIHASLLPRWRGAAPIQRALLAGDCETGITIMQMDTGLDTGDWLSLHPVPIAAEDTAASLHDKLAAEGARAIVSALTQLDCLTPHKQPNQGVTYAHKLSKAEAEIDWNQSAQTITRSIRAYNPTPGAYTLLDNQLLKIWTAYEETGEVEPGQVVKVTPEGIWVGCKEGMLRITELQVAGGRRLTAQAFNAGRSADLTGARLGK